MRARAFVIPGVLSYEKYEHRRATWNPYRQTVGLDARFYEGAELRLYPKEWLQHALRLHLLLIQIGRHKYRTTAKGIGIDPGEGKASSAMVAVDEYGVLDVSSPKTPDTNVVPFKLIEFGTKWNCPPTKWVFDRGGGGKQHADRMRAGITDPRTGKLTSYPVQTVSFGESLALDPKRGLVLIEERKRNKEDRYTYKRRRDELYGTMSEWFDPSLLRTDPHSPREHISGFAIPPEHYPLFAAQLGPIPLLYDEHGRLELPPKHRRGEGIDDTNRLESARKSGRGIKTLVELIGYSPDEADALALAIWAMTHKSTRQTAGAI